MTDSAKVLVWGAGGHSIMVCSALRTMDLYPFGFIDDLSPERRGQTFDGAIILGSSQQGMDEAQKHGVKQATVAFGNCKARVSAFRILESRGFRSVAVRHIRSTVDPWVDQQPGSVIAPGAVINGKVLLGAYCIINTGAIVEHDCAIGEGAMIAPGAVLCGSVTIGPTAWIGAGSVIRENIIIGAGAIVGAGSLVVKNVPENSIWYGSPARFIRDVL